VTSILSNRYGLVAYSCDRIAT